MPVKHRYLSIKQSEPCRYLGQSGPSREDDGCKGPEAECAECVMSGEVSVLVQRDRGGGSRGQVTCG